MGNHGFGAGIDLQNRIATGQVISKGLEFFAILSEMILQKQGQWDER